MTGDFGNRLYTPQDTRLVFDQSRHSTYEKLGLSLWTADGAQDLSMEFKSTVGSNREVEVGYYDHAQRSAFAGQGRPGISMSPLGFCSDQSGNFEVKEIQRDNGSITRLWLTYERWCDREEVAFGELRIGYPEETSTEQNHRSIRWPHANIYPGRKSFDVPITLRSTAADQAAEVTSVSVSGPHAGDFPLRSNDCVGTVPASGCTVAVGFAPSAPGPRHAELTITTTAGDRRVPLDGFGTPGVSDWVVDLDYDDPYYEDRHVEMAHSASRDFGNQVRSQAFDDDGTIWSVIMWPPVDEERLSVGRYTVDTSGTYGVFRISVARGNAGCEEDAGYVDIDDIRFTGPDMVLDRLDAFMNVHCRGGVAYSVRAHIRYRAREDITAPSPVTRLTSSRAGNQTQLTWRNPNDKDLAGVLVRWYGGTEAPSATDGGKVAYLGTGESTTFTAPHDKPVAASVWTYDREGNVAEEETLLLPPS
ncbi:hypothetical protein ACHZ98_34170 [Streptomyces sp. MAR4 CNY-716]